MKVFRISFGLVLLLVVGLAILGQIDLGAFGAILLILGIASGQEMGPGHPLYPGWWIPIGVAVTGPAFALKFGHGTL